MPHFPISKGRTKPPTPLSSFDPRFRELLLQGATGILEIPCANRGEAIRLRQRLNQYRYAVKQHFGSDTAEWEPLYRCIVRQQGNVLTLCPRDSEFNSALARAGVPAVLPDAILPDDFLKRLADDEGERSEPDVENKS